MYWQSLVPSDQRVVRYVWTYRVSDTVHQSHSTAKLAKTHESFKKTKGRVAKGHEEERHTCTLLIIMTSYHLTSLVKVVDLHPNTTAIEDIEGISFSSS